MKRHDTTWNDMKQHETYTATIATTTATNNTHQRDDECTD